MPLSASFRRELRNVTWFAALVARARGKCEICGKPTHRLCLDHRHSCCGPENACRACARGLLCRACNAGLGMFQDDPGLLVSAAAYLLEHDGATELVAS